MQKVIPIEYCALPVGTRTTPLTKRMIETDGLIVPVLGKVIGRIFIPADYIQAERIQACYELGFSDVLIEDTFERGDVYSAYFD